ncbi:hypothetical protein A3E04_00340 [Candidatus Kuenenbacteria bacterium RIFCSPHIGHO2_12_FULL_42_14]|uniref:Uncharacterized protein n=4 Tax=Candidatus Kueneniibacteriota TaxID=1752740 RepID=A0A0G0Z0Y5_9BACT|nr:MAG: hypothetical protein UV02_C0013G0007 [Candidatus Kuenenbacteria bacterium GW2011_GWA2_42_15]OGG89443.1 MAG: hypothetical protein A3C68_00165 [Candidatus Kuenenbacteria bacterium RIFCSPHIGHO2_02_FULL_42_29]OGG90492.1 MAG: hypothetical protein A3H55_01615 [Candidatus Kuenenbacteria bacterium RIFCSPLOWO2_02_FULL_42_16]OGG95623.1 MAG: hypothetical protein A2V95_02800 [Candidatus Kuenenbacteria bacterium RBG_16_41_7]OGG98728.1 MAG: hypothetical protein A3E04_00340 [Candidatus Kuenenbacteria 
MQKNRRITKDEQPVTQKILLATLGDFTEKVIFPGVDVMLEKRIQPVEKRLGGVEKNIQVIKYDINNLEKSNKSLKEQMEKDKNEILNSNDRLMGELQKLNTEVAAHTKSYRDLDERIVYLEKMNDLVLKKLQLA